MSTHPNSVELETPIKRGEHTFATIELRKPTAGELRGVHLAELVQLDVDSLIKVIPRVSVPTLTDHEVRGLDPADLLALGAKVVAFLLPKAAMDSSPAA